MTSSPIMTSYMLWILNLIIYQDRSDYGQSDVRYWIRELASWWRHRLFQCFLSHYTLGETSFDSPKYKGSRFSLTSNPEDKEEVSISWRSIPVKILSTGHLKFYFMLPALRLQKSHSEKTLIYGVIWGFSRLWTWIFEFWCERGQMT